jgi:hypothetical protein
MRKFQKLLPLLMWVSICLFFSQGCSLPIANQTRTDAPKSGQVIYQDDFSSPLTGWDTWKDETSSAAYQGEGLRMTVHSPHSDYWSRPGKRFTDTRIAVKATKIGGSDNNDYGILCRYNDRNNFYALVISSDGYSGIIKVKDGKYQVISAPTLSYTDILHKGSATNFIGVDCIGPRLILYANGSALVEAKDNDFPDGEVGLLVGTYDKGGVDLLFDDFVVSQP